LKKESFSPISSNKKKRWVKKNGEKGVLAAEILPGGKGKGQEKGAPREKIVQGGLGGGLSRQERRL